MISNNKKQKLRLEGFTDEWIEMTLGEVCEVKTGKANAEDHEENGEFILFDRSGVLKKSSKFLFDTEAIIVPGEGQEFKPQHYIGKFNLHQRAYALFNPKNINIKFIYFYIEHNHKYLLAQSVGTTVPSLRLPMFEKWAILFPSLPEQQAIATLFTTLDNHIILLQRKLKAYQDYKKSLLQKLFPNKDSKVPQLRLKWFNDNWRETTLGEVCEILNSQRKPVMSVNRVKGNFPYYGASGIIDYVGNYIFDETLVLLGEDGAKWGKNDISSFIVRGKFWANNHVHVLRPINIIDIFLVNFLNYSDLGKYITGFAPPKLTLENMKKIPIFLPSIPEQQAIATLFTTLDNHIAKISTQLELYNKKKKAILQNIFPSI